MTRIENRWENKMMVDLLEYNEVKVKSNSYPIRLGTFEYGRELGYILSNENHYCFRMVRVHREK